MKNHYEIQYKEYEAMVQNANSIILIWKIDGTVRFMNTFGLDFFGYTAEELVGQNIVGTIIQEQDMYENDLKTMIEDIGINPDKYKNNENENVTQKGERVWVSWTNTIILNPDIGKDEILSVGNDITAQKRAEKGLKESEEKYRLLVENADDAIFIVQDGKIHFANPKTTMSTGYSESELYDMPFINLIHPDDKKTILDRHMKRLKGRNLPTNYQFRILNKLGTEIWAQINAVMISWKGQPATLNIVRDITDQKKTEKVLFEEKKKLEDALAEIRTLRGILPICSHCKKIRDDKGYWNQIEEYIQGHSEVQFSHSICKKCAEEFYPGMDLYGDEENQD